MKEKPSVVITDDHRIMHEGLRAMDVLKLMAKLTIAVWLLTPLAVLQAADVEWAPFLARNDMVWRGLPRNWDSGPFLGNGRLGTIFWRNEAGALHFEVSRSDLYDHRRLEGYGPLFARCRIPNGHFELSFGQGRPTGDMRLDLWNAEARGRVTLGQSSWELRSFTHANRDVIVIEITGTGAAPAMAWCPDVSKPTRNRNPPKDLKGYPPQTQREVDGIHVSVQDMPEGAEYHTDGQGIGQYATAWGIVTTSNRTVVYISTRLTYPGATAADEAVSLVKEARRAGLSALEKSHREWWHAYYPKSFLSVPDSAIESYYWIQLYKMASASRKGGPVLDLMGPWFMTTYWPGVWWNLNIQLTYWPFYMSNHLEEAEPLIESVWSQRANLAKNAAPHGADSYAIGRATGLDCLMPVGAEVGNLPWTLHNLWLHYRSTMDDAYLKEKLFPLMKGGFRYLRHILVVQPDGTLVLPKTASPEYTESVASCSYTLACLRWLASTLMVADARLKADDPVVAECREVLARLEPYPIDPATGIMVGKGTTLANSHRHWSHLFMIYPFYEYTWDQPDRVELMERSLRNWTDKPGAFAGYSWLGAASMHAAAGRGDKALQFLHSFLNKSSLPNTLYREGSPVIETPLAFARSLQEMLLTSHGDLIRVFPGVPVAWGEVAFADLRTEGAFLVSAKREQGVTRWVRIVSLAGEPCRIRTGLSGALKSQSSKRVVIKELGNGVVEVKLAKGASVVLYTGNEPPAIDLAPVPPSGPPNPWGGQKPGK